MKKCLALVAAMMVSPFTFAHGPTPQKVVESISINAPVDKVWAISKDFAGIAQWNKELSKSEGENTPGGKRTLIFPNGEQLVEELDVLDEAAHELSYRLHHDNVKALPASSYSATIKLTAEGASTKVEWKSRLYRGDTGNFPPDELNDEAATKAMQKFFKNGLEGLKKHAEGG